MTGDRDQDQMHPDDLKNLIVFIIAAVAVWIMFDHYLLKPKVEALRQAQQIQQAAKKGEMEGAGGTLTELRPREEIINDTPRVRIETPRISGSIALTGGRIDDISLKDYFKTKQKPDPVVLFSPMGSFHPRYATFGWVASAEDQKVPGKRDQWNIAGNSGTDTVLTPETPVTLYWDNGSGLRFERTMEIDKDYLIKVTQRVVNNTGKSVTLNPYAVLAQHGLPEDLFGNWIIHEGPIGYIKGELLEISYKKMPDEKGRLIDADEGWLGLTERYWFTSLFPEAKTGNKFQVRYIDPLEAGHIQPRYQIDVMGAGKTLKPGESNESVTRLYAGPKKLSLLEAYEKQFGWRHIDLSVDFGIYYFLTKPLFYLLHWLGDFAGNFGLGIIMLTFVVRIFVFPLANTSYKSFAKLRKVSPQMYVLREKYSGDKEKLQEELVKLYEKEKVNPMAGCLPILIQIPIFFALFKVLQISVEMRHAPFYGWVHDLSAPDPTSIFNLFGLIPWNPPTPLMIGAWPCFMLVFMILQKKMSPPPQDKMQKAMMDFMPFFITYILSKYAVGLVIYWTFSNGLSVIQQYVIMKSMGVEPHLFKSKEQKDMEAKIKEGPAIHPELAAAGHKAEEALFGEEKPAEEKKPVSKPKPKKKKK